MRVALTPHLTLTCRVGILTVISSFQRLSKLCNTYKGADSPACVFPFGILRIRECSSLQTRVREMRRKRWDGGLVEGCILFLILFQQGGEHREKI